MSIIISYLISFEPQVFQRGVHIRALQELLGHKTLIMTQRYSRLAPEQLRSPVNLLEGVIGEKQELVGEGSHRSGFSSTPTGQY